METVIGPYDPGLPNHFGRLNRIWLEELNAFEAIHREVLDNPEQSILSRGGQIFYAWTGEEVTGTVALVPADPDTIELTKLAVDPRHRRKGVARALMAAAHQAAADAGARQIRLYSQVALEAAIRMYRVLGYYEIPIRDSRYAKADISMEYPIGDGFCAVRLRTWLDRLREGPDLVYALVNGLPSEILDRSTTEDSWSIRQILQHLADSEAHAYIRLRRGLAEPGLPVIAYDQDKWAVMPGSEYRSPDEALALFAALRADNSRLAETLTADRWTERGIYHPEHGLMSLWDWLRIYAHHNHAGQISRILRACDPSAPASTSQ